ncbi:MAG: hypothetical protein U0031_23545 [Thermomicrobiales bacterium]
MDEKRTSAQPRFLHSGATRRRALALLALATGFRSAAAAKKKRTCKDCCGEDGRRCTQASSTCKAKNCLRGTAPFTVEARWSTLDSQHRTFLFVPNVARATKVSPYINDMCTAEASGCEQDVYPFTCVTGSLDSGNETTTIRKTIPGTYEFWIETGPPRPKGDLVVTLRDAKGVIRVWTNPLVQDVDRKGWHVFDLDGKTGSVISIDEVIGRGQLGVGLLPAAAVQFGTEKNVCP